MEQIASEPFNKRGVAKTAAKRVERHEETNTFS
jgi:hypothetical protein